MCKLITQICLIAFLLVVPSNADCISDDLIGLADFASKWLDDDCIKPSWCSGADINQSANVNFVDFTMAFGPVEPLILVDNGVCNVSIRNVSVPSTVETYATQQLQVAFQSACGVTPQINPGTPAAIEIRLGLANRFNVGVGDSSEHAYAVRRTYDNKIELVGNSSAAVMWAVDDFCKQVLHVSWPIANDVLVLEDGPQSTVSVGRLCKVEAPDFQYRGWIVGDNTDGYHYNHLIGNWMAHNRQSTLYCPIQYIGTTYGDSYNKMLARGIEPETTMHNFNWLVPASIYYDDVNHPESYHPEYFPLINDVRVRPDSESFYVQLCISNSGVFDIVKGKIASGFSSYQKLKIFGVAQNDGDGGWCQCPNCAAWDGAQAGTGVYSNRLIHFINLLADYFAIYNPGKYIGTYAYGETKLPPDFNVSNNVAITFGTGGRNCMKKLTDPSDSSNAALMVKLNGWLSRAANVHLWDYYFFPNMDYCPMPYARTICEEYGELKALGLKGVCSETYPSMWPSMRILSYTVARTAWDTSLDFNDILDDYDYEAYGPAASYMKSYYLLYENRIYAHVPFMGNNGAPAQLFPAAFTSGDLTTLNGYLTSAAAAATASGSQANINAVAEANTMFQKFKSLSIDPATIPGIGPNLVNNPSAESGSAGWEDNIYQDVGDYSFSVSSSAPHSGSNSFKIECTGDRGILARWYQTGIPVTVGKKYAARFWIRATGGASGVIELWPSGGVYIPVGWTDSNDQWVQLVVPEFTASGSTINLYLATSGPGTVYFDDILISELPE